jgi:hypothetical protein
VPFHIDFSHYIALQYVAYGNTFFRHTDLVIKVLGSTFFRETRLVRQKYRFNHS